MCVGGGVGPENGVKTYHMFKGGELNTFSAEDAAATESQGVKMIGKVDMPIRTLKSILDENNAKNVDFLSIDAEGLDLEILKSVDFNGLRPKIICVETKSWSEGEQRRSPTTQFLEGNGYSIAASTPINSIFVDSRADRTKKT
jgi:hypothetical protein